MSENVGSIYYDVTLDTSQLIGAQREVDRKLDTIGKSGDRLQARFTAIAAGISAALSAIAIEGLVSKVVTAQRQFDVLFSSLKTVTGGVDKASAAWDRLSKFAANTPYTLDQTVNGFVKLKALGLDPSERAMESFGNTSSAMGKDLTQMIEAVADASTGEFERLKEFGIKAKSEGDNVSFTFQGVTTTVKNSADDIVEYLTKIGEVNFANAMSERMKTLDGDLSNLEDSWNNLYLAISKSGVGDLVRDTVKGATNAIQELTLSIESGGLTEYFDGLKNAMVAAEVVVVSLAGAMTARLVVAIGQMVAQATVASTAVAAMTTATSAFSAVISALGGPIGIGISALALLALNWDAVSRSAKTAAEISEDAADRMARALRKSTGAARKDLQTLVDEANNGIKKIDDRLAANKQGNQLGRGRGNSALGGRLSEKEIEALRASRIEYEMQASRAKEQLDKLDPKGGRGFINPEAVPLENLNKKPPPEEKTKAKPKDKTSGKQPTENVKLASDPLGDFAAEALRDQSLRLPGRGAQASSYAQDIVDERDSPEKKLRAQYEARKQTLDEMLADELLSHQLHAEAVAANEASLNETLDKLEAERIRAAAAARSALLQGGQQLFGEMAELTKTFAGEQSGAYKAMFAVSKAFAIADATVKLGMAIMNANFSAPFPSNFAAMASVAAAGAGVISSINGANFAGGRQYGGSTSAGSLYRVNEGGRPEMFTASNGNQYMLGSQPGTVTPANQIGGSTVTIHQTISIGAGVNAAQVAQAMNAAKEQAKAEIYQSIRRGGAFS